MFEILLTAISIVFLLVMSAVFSGSETALTAASRARMYALERDGDKNAALVNYLLSIQERLIGTILIGNNLVNILASALATSLFLNLFGAAGVAYATIAMTTAVVIFAEVLPKTYALLNPDHTAIRVAPLFKPLVAFFYPLTRAVEYIVRNLLRLLGRDLAKDAQLLSAHEELRGAIDLHHQEGSVVKLDRDMLDGILDLRELTVSDIMLHRTKMESIDVDDSLTDIAEQVLSSSFTRLPLWRDEPENIIGILHAKDFLSAYARAKGDANSLDIDDLANEPWFVPDTTGLKDQLNAFLRRKAHIAMVVDEYGEVMGLVTLEDILEEIVGQIADEHDVVQTGVRPLPNGAVEVDGSVPIRDLNRLMDWELPDDEATTIAGLVIHEAQTIPEPGHAFTFYGFRFQILRRHRNRLTALLITPVTTHSNP